MIARRALACGTTKYKVSWQGYPGQESWERGVNVAGARASVEEFWLAFDQQMPESEVFRKNKRWKQMIGIDKKQRNDTRQSYRLI